MNKDENVPILDKLVQLRHEMALVLGYSSYSEMVLENKMAKDPITVQKFEDDLINRISKQGEKELQ